MDPLTLLAIGAGGGLLGNILGEGSRRSENRIEAMKTRMSPWLHIDPGQMKQAESPIKDILSGGLTAVGIGNSMDKYKAANDYLTKYGESSPQAGRLSLATLSPQYVNPITSIMSLSSPYNSLLPVYGTP